MKKRDGNPSIKAPVPLKKARLIEDCDENTSKSGINSESFPFGLSWTQPTESLFWALDSPEIPGAEKILAFDMDHTLVVPKTGKKFAKGRGDWVWWNPKVVPTLKEYYNNGFKVVIFTNQAGIEKKKTKKGDLTGKILDLCKELGFPMQAFICGGNNHWRKPHTTMWDYLSSHMNKSVNINLTKSFYIGDAAGRIKNWRPKHKRDFSCSDKKFAINVGVRFMTPEEFFLQDVDVANAKFEWKSLDPIKFLKENPEGMNVFEGSSITKSEQEVICFVGLPASGKSTFAKKYLVPKGYIWINRDTLKTPAKCKKALKEALQEGKSAVIDNTNPTAKRQEYIGVAKKCGVSVRCFYFDASRELANHLNFYRERLSEGKRRRVPAVAFNMYKCRFEEPSKDEGFTEIATVKFVPDFENAQQRKWFQNWT